MFGLRFDRRRVWSCRNGLLRFFGDGRRNLGLVANPSFLVLLVLPVFPLRLLFFALPLRLLLFSFVPLF